MGYELGISVWFDSTGHCIPDVFVDVLSCLPKPQPYQDYSNALKLPPKKYGQLSINYPSQDRRAVEFEIEPWIDNNLLLNGLAEEAGAEFTFESSFTLWKYDMDEMALFYTVAPLRVYYNRFSREEYGTLEVFFDRASYFKPTNDLSEHLEVLAPLRREYVQSALNSNYSMVVQVARRLITRLNPDHLFICTEREIHPLTSHSVFHRDIRAFEQDFRQLPLIDSSKGNHLNLPPSGLPRYRSLPGFGYLRLENAYKHKLAKFVSRLEAVTDFLQTHPSRPLLTERDLEQYFSRLAVTRMEKFGMGYLLSTDSPCTYLEEPYFGMMEHIMAT